jgi:3'(2'), 5'-bisphosphate nucleotidase
MEVQQLFRNLIALDNREKLIMNRSELILTAVKASFEAARAIMHVYEGAIDVDMKSDGSPLTAADKAAHVVIAKALSVTGLPILSEEGKNISYEERKKWQQYWLVDPLDGTKEFIKRNGEFTVNIALMEDDRPVAGVICQPVKEVAFAGFDRLIYKFSFSENPSYESAEIVKSISGIDENIMRIVASRSHRSAETEEFIDQIRSSGKKVELLTAGSALKFCILAEGRADVYPRFAPTMEWDTAAGHALLKAAGKNIYLQDGKEMTYNKPQLVNDWFIAR